MERGDIKNLPLFYRGKVRDVYDLEDKLLFVATDRVSAFDRVLPDPIPYKGKVLTLLSAFWFQKTSHIIKNHFVKILNGRDCSELGIGEEYALRSMIVRKAEVLPFECVVRGYITGSAWEEYEKGGKVFGIDLPPGLRECEKLPEPIFTPTTKEREGHDRPISFEDMEDALGSELAKLIRDKSMELYSFASEYALSKGIIIADTKFEFGLIDGELHLVDELLTPDSSRFWDLSLYRPGFPQAGFDKQPLRDWLKERGWRGEGEAPPLSPEIIEETSRRYVEILKRITGRDVRG